MIRTRGFICKPLVPLTKDHNHGTVFIEKFGSLGNHGFFRTRGADMRTVIVVLFRMIRGELAAVLTILQRATGLDLTIKEVKVRTGCHGSFSGLTDCNNQCRSG